MADGRANNPRAYDHAILIGFWGLATLVNVFKPFHMDDTAGLLIARAIAEAPVHPMGQMLNWLNTAEPIFVTNQPHLFFYITAATVGLFGNSEIILHLMLSLFSLIAIYSIYHLARRYAPQHALWLVCSFVIGPGFLINQNVMTDVPLLAFLGLSVLLLTNPKNPRAAAGFAVFSLAVLTKYTALFLFPALIWAAMRQGRALVWVALPVAALAAWSLFNIWDYGAVHITSRPPNVGGLFPSPKLAFAVVCNLGLFAVPIAAALMVGSRLWIIGWLLGFALFFWRRNLGAETRFSAVHAGQRGAVCQRIYGPYSGRASDYSSVTFALETASKQAHDTGIQRADACALAGRWFWVSGDIRAFHGKSPCDVVIAAAGNSGVVWSSPENPIAAWHSCSSQLGNLGVIRRSERFYICEILQGQCAADGSRGPGIRWPRGPDFHPWPLGLAMVCPQHRND